MNADQQNSSQEVTARIAELERLTRRFPSRFAGGGSFGPPNLWVVIGGNLLPGCLTQGIQKRTDAVAGSELPVGTGGPGIVVQSATPIPAGLPNGVGVIRNVGTNSYAFALLDTDSLYTWDAPHPLPIIAGALVNLDKVVGGTTYRYPCYRIDGG